MLSSKRNLMLRLAVVGIACAAALPAMGQTHVIDVVADHDSRFKIPGQGRAEITVKAGEPVLLRIDARKGKSWNRDGAVHGFTLLRKKDRHKVANWDLEFKAGKHEFALTAPVEPGEYEVLCTVVCSEDHEQMRMSFVVLP